MNMPQAARLEQLHRRIASLKPVFPAGIVPSGARGRILCAALNLFADHGYGGTSVRDICIRAKVQATTLYAHFPSKEHVLAEIIRLGHEEHFRRLRNALLETQPDPPLQLATLIRTHVHSHCEHAMLAVVANAELHALSGAMAAPILAVRQQSEALLIEVLERGIRLGIFKVPDTYLTLRAIGGMGLRVAYWYTPDCGRTPEQVADAFVEFALRIVGVNCGSERAQA